MSTATAHAVCKDHGTTNPCASCAADHIVGAHAAGTKTGTCHKCRAPRRRPHPAMPDAPALAANDTDHLETEGS